MKLKTVKLISCILIAVIIVLVVAAIQTKQRIYGIVAVVLCIGTGIFESAFYKCPNCGQFLGSFGHKCCPHCGKAIKESEKAE